MKQANKLRGTQSIFIRSLIITSHASSGLFIPQDCAHSCMRVHWCMSRCICVEVYIYVHICVIACLYPIFKNSSQAAPWSCLGCRWFWKLHFPGESTNLLSLTPQLYSKMVTITQTLHCRGPRSNYIFRSATLPESGTIEKICLGPPFISQWFADKNYQN